MIFFKFHYVRRINERLVVTRKLLSDGGISYIKEQVKKELSNERPSRYCYIGSDDH